MVHNIFRMLICLMVVGLNGCGTPQLFTVTVYESPDRVVRLQTVEREGTRKPFSHPVFLTEEEISRVLQGLYVELGNTTLALPFGGQSDGVRHRAFSEAEIKFLAPLVVKGLNQATPEEVVTFYETGEISSQYRLITSGGVYVQEDYIYVMLSNYRVKKPIWQDNDEYDAPYRLDPLEPISPQPGQVLFDSPEFMAPPMKTSFLESLKAKPWLVGVRYKSGENRLSGKTSG